MNYKRLGFEHISASRQNRQFRLEGLDFGGYAVCFKMLQAGRRAA